jgi:hypothetical protein
VRRAGTASAVVSLESFGESVEEIPDARLEIAVQPPKSALTEHAAPTYTDAVAKRPSVRKQRS